MRYPVYNFSVYQGADEEFPFTFYSELDGVESPIDLSSCSFIMTLRQAYNKPVMDVLTSDNKRILIGTIIDGVFTETNNNANTALIKFPHEVTINFTFPSAVYDLFKINTEDNRELLLQGAITINKSVSYG